MPAPKPRSALRRWPRSTMPSPLNRTLHRSYTRRPPPLSRQYARLTRLPPTQCLTRHWLKPCKLWTPRAQRSLGPVHPRLRSHPSPHPQKGNLQLGSSPLRRGPEATARTSLSSSPPQTRLSHHFQVWTGRKGRDARFSLPLRKLFPHFPRSHRGVYF